MKPQYTPQTDTDRAFKQLFLSDGAPSMNNIHPIAPVAPEQGSLTLKDSNAEAFCNGQKM